MFASKKRFLIIEFLLKKINDENLTAEDFRDEVKGHLKACEKFNDFENLIDASENTDISDVEFRNIVRAFLFDASLFKKPEDVKPGMAFWMFVEGIRESLIRVTEIKKGEGKVILGSFDTFEPFECEMDMLLRNSHIHPCSDEEFKDFVNKERKEIEKEEKKLEMRKERISFLGRIKEEK